MGEFVQLHAADGQELSAYVSKPAGEPIAGLVVIQEIFGVICAHPQRDRQLCERRIPRDSSRHF